MRVDPHDLNKRFHSSKLRSKAASLTGQSEVALFGEQVPGHVQIKDNQALVECQLSSGLPLIVRVPLSYYKGIGARYLTSNQQGSPIICVLELVHADPHLCIPLFAGGDLEDAAVDWQSWARRYGLYMLHQPLGYDDFVPVDGFCPQTSLIDAMPAPRRHHSHFAARRPRFLTRRKVGMSGPMPSISGREMIARR
ncbi:MAG: DUF6101 family protein [Cohaesibacter sp.]|nr:DUF6101 family protein [Cohaesibacter sp.]